MTNHLLVHEKDGTKIGSSIQTNFTRHYPKRKVYLRWKDHRVLIKSVELAPEIEPQMVDDLKQNISMKVFLRSKDHRVLIQSVELLEIARSDDDSDVSEIEPQMADDLKQNISMKVYLRSKDHRVLIQSVELPEIAEPESEAFIFSSDGGEIDDLFGSDDDSSDTSSSSLFSTDDTALESEDSGVMLERVVVPPRNPMDYKWKCNFCTKKVFYGSRRYHLMSAHGKSNDISTDSSFSRAELRQKYLVSSTRRQWELNRIKHLCRKINSRPTASSSSSTDLIDTDATKRRCAGCQELSDKLKRQKLEIQKLQYEVDIANKMHVIQTNSLRHLQRQLVVGQNQ